MHVLVTGQGGFTGKYLRDELVTHGHKVVGLKSDLMDAKALFDEISEIKPDGVINLAGISFVDDKNCSRIYQVNLLGTRNLLLALSRHASTLQHVILASSANVYGNSTEGMLSEVSPLSPASDYAVSKIAMEYMASLWADKLPITIVRPFNYTGIGQPEHFLIPKIVSHFKAKKVIIELGNLDVAREFGDVRSVAEIYRKLLEKKPSHQTMNICTGHAYSLKNVISMCEDITGHKIDIQVNPLYVRTHDVRMLLGNNERLKQCIGPWKHIPFEETLKWMLNA